MLKEPLRKRIRCLASLPIISAMIVPLAILDVCFEIYHRTCFFLYEIPYVSRKKYILIKDRGGLPYLNWAEKLYCMYCGYVNGLLQYTAEIAGETEKFWCAIKHEKYRGFEEPPHHKRFAAYGDEEAWIQSKERLLDERSKNKK